MLLNFTLNEVNGENKSMFVQNLTKETLTYQSDNGVIEIKPLKIKYISDLVASAKDIKKEFGDKVAIHSLEAKRETKAK